MPEDAFNLFLFICQDVVHEVGGVAHHLVGTDDEMLGRLRAAVNSDFPICRKFPLPEVFRGITSEQYSALNRLGRQLELFELVFIALGAPHRPLYCLTAIVDGSVVIDAQDTQQQLLLGKFQGHPKLGLGVMPDYLEVYMTTAGLDLPRLINDDYFNAIRLLYKNAHYVSCMKLLASCIDTLAFLEFGDAAGNFVQWLAKYADVTKLGVTAAELWEMRNSILHMSNLDSRKVLSGHERRISFFLGKRGMPAMQDMNLTYFNLTDLIVIVADGVSKWLASIDADKEKLLLFVQRYDRVVADSRMAKPPLLS